MSAMSVMPVRGELGLLGAHVRDEVADQSRCTTMAMPPMVGVPAFFSWGWANGPSSRICWPMPLRPQHADECGRGQDADDEGGAGADEERDHPAGSGGSGCRARAPQPGGHQLQPDRPAALHQHRVAVVRDAGGGVERGGGVGDLGDRHAGRACGGRQRRRPGPTATRTSTETAPTSSPRAACSDALRSPSSSISPEHRDAAPGHVAHGPALRPRPPSTTGWRCRRRRARPRRHGCAPSPCATARVARWRARPRARRTATPRASATAAARLALTTWCTPRTASVTGPPPQDDSIRKRGRSSASSSTSRARTSASALPAETSTTRADVRAASPGVSGSPASRTARPWSSSASSSSPFALATPARPPSGPAWASPMFVITPTVGRAMAQSAAMSPCARAPISSTSASVAVGAAEQGERHARFVVVRTGAGVHVELGGQGGGDEILGAGLPGRARDADDGGAAQARRAPPVRAGRARRRRRRPARPRRRRARAGGVTEHRDASRRVRTASATKS